MLIKKINDLDKRLNEEISSLRIFVKERFSILEGMLDIIIQQKISSLSSNVDEKDVAGSDSKNDNDGVNERHDIFDVDKVNRRKEEEDKRNKEVEKKNEEEEKKIKEEKENDEEIWTRGEEK